jgi:hypothetical protein
MSMKSVDEYISSRPEAVQGILHRVRSIIRKAMPGAEEVISYQIPAYKIQGCVVLYFAGWKHHYSLYPSTDPNPCLLVEVTSPSKLRTTIAEKSYGTTRAFPPCGRSCLPPTARPG